MRYCKCGACFIDGGRDYTRFGMEHLVEPRIDNADIIIDTKTGEHKIFINNPEDKK
jgi:hypothetical protein